MVERANPDMTVDMTSLEFLKNYDPAVVYWGLTATGKARVATNTFPEGIGIQGSKALRIMNRLGVVEEDEMGGFLGLTPGGSKRLLKRLAGFGLIAQAT